ncbi:TetR/AcrR family transcriptional regulator [Streptomyces sp. NPDC060243]|uniref:TetR/AcrR family transcriptional regulator n=1 Tax=Streptomyces sp. NPDC060243 TaxID=3347081 RepID=UPI00365312A3
MLAMTEGMTNGRTDGVTGGTAGGMTGGRTDGAPGGVPDGTTGGVAEGTTGATADDAARSRTGGAGASCDSGCAGKKAGRPRADAVRNRERIIDAAREMAAEHGAEVSIDEVARRAGVGNATVYRHFHDRPALIREAIRSVMDRTAERAEEALTLSGPFDALCVFAHGAVEDRAGAMCGMLSANADEAEREHPDLRAARTRLEAGVATLLDRAREAGELRPDVGAGDLMFVLSQLARPLPGCTAALNDRYVHRHLQLFLEGLRAPARSPLPGSAATLEALRTP